MVAILSALSSSRFVPIMHSSNNAFIQDAQGRAPHAVLSDLPFRCPSPGAPAVLSSLSRARAHALSLALSLSLSRSL